ncbi:MAG: hypothetical protein JRF53_00625 [Deltaproteobacteria bacterium]|nr:hypothetical protein [Deltaproteobacteria bacterium]
MTALNGMGEITNYYGFSAPTILALIRHRGFPANKLSGIWASDTGLIDQWRKDQILNGSMKKQPKKKGEKQPVKRKDEKI